MNGLIHGKHVGSTWYTVSMEVLGVTFISIIPLLCRQLIESLLAGNAGATEASSPNIFIGKSAGGRQ